MVAATFAEKLVGIRCPQIVEGLVLKWVVTWILELAFHRDTPEKDYLQMIFDFRKRLDVINEFRVVCMI